MQVRPILRSVAAATGSLAKIRGNFGLLPIDSRFKQQASPHRLLSSLSSLTVTRFQAYPFCATTGDRWEWWNRHRGVPRSPGAVFRKAYKNISRKCSMNNTGVARVHWFNRRLQGLFFSYGMFCGAFGMEITAMKI